MQKLFKTLTPVVLIVLLADFSFALNLTNLSASTYRCSIGNTYNVLIETNVSGSNHRAWNYDSMCSLGILTSKIYETGSSNSELKVCADEVTTDLYLCQNEFLELNGNTGLGRLDIKHGDEWEVVNALCFQAPCPKFIMRRERPTNPRPVCIQAPCPETLNDLIVN